ncbi:MAG: hypothetical protein ABI467_11940 [Kofleriaceae bacterium]
MKFQSADLATGESSWIRSISVLVWERQTTTLTSPIELEHLLDLVTGLDASHPELRQAQALLRALDNLAH